MAAHVTAAPPTRATASGVVEMSVWTTYEATRRAPTRDVPDRSTAPAHNRRRSSRGKSTTIGFHGLTRAPRTLSE